ncbi:hypothetical protein DMENIID0001_090550 [Sergentomyia squamirostris]
MVPATCFDSNASNPNASTAKVSTDNASNCQKLRRVECFDGENFDGQCFELSKASASRTYLFLLEQDLFLTRNEDEELNSFLEYFAKTWVGYIDFTGRGTKPRFDIAWWNCYEAVLEDQPKTNNGIEGWHHAFAGSIGGPHPSIWNFIKFILSEQSLQEIRRNQNTQGTSNTRQRRLDSDLKALVLNYSTTSRLNYLSNIACLYVNFSE